MELFIAPTGQVRYLYGEELDLVSLGLLTIRRASHVEPTDGGRWTADLSPIGGPTLGPFDQRSQALAAETRWIEGHLPSIPG
ncbi:MAG TPA: hypothetical protein VG055_14055 [Planctomycetaceae bacterium]|jgi:hypothetical protein|nr:hypothetical protein [Planctomycetaceae bacterium]